MLMKKGAFLLVAVALFLVTNICAQEVPAGVVQAFRKGSTQELQGYLNDKVELIVQNKSRKILKTEAETQLTAFFEANRVSGFTVNHEGKRDDSSFVVGTLTTANGNFRVNCFLRRVQNNYLIHQIRIDKTNE